MIVELDGVEHDFPDDATQDQIRQALSSCSGAKNSTISSWPSTYMQMVEEGKEGCGGQRPRRRALGLPADPAQKSDRLEITVLRRSSAEISMWR
jgi:hypothetical protein